MRLKHTMILLLIMLLQIETINQTICFPTCSGCTGGSQSNNYDKCTSCSSGFAKPTGAGTTFACEKNPYNINPIVVDDRWEPCGISDGFPAAYTPAIMKATLPL